MKNAVGTRFETLKFLADDPAAYVLEHLARNPGSVLSEALSSNGGSNASLEREFARRNLVAEPALDISTQGKVCFQCVEGIEGASVLELVDNLRDLDPAASRVSIVREGMTSKFVEFLGRLDPIRRLMICSPWINLDTSRLRKFIKAIELSERIQGYRPEISVLTRPFAYQPAGEDNQTLGYLRRIGALINFEARLHSKLYIIEAGDETTVRYAFVGSENFTKVRFQELGIFVNNDNLLIDDLIRYFLASSR